jgi:hypothetical protein
VVLVRRGEGFLYSARDGLLLMAFLDRLLPVTVLVAVGLSGVRLARLLLDGLLLVVLLVGERLGEGEMDIGLSGELISALRFLCDGCCGSAGCILLCWRGWRSVRASFSSSISSNVVLYFAFSE